MALKGNKYQNVAPFSDFIKNSPHVKLQNATRESVKWHREKIKELGKVTARDLLKNNQERLRNTSQIAVGRFYTFNYWAVGRDELPYWDMNPIIVIISMDKDSFLGLNFHYLDYRTRAVFLDKLYALLNNDKFDDSTKLQLTYGLLKSMSSLKYYKPCIKKYLKTQLRSKMLYIRSEEWLPMLLLPTQQFQKKSASYVWSQSAKIIAGK